MLRLTCYSQHWWPCTLSFTLLRKKTGKAGFFFQSTVFTVLRFASSAAETAADRLRNSVGGATRGLAGRGGRSPRQPGLCRGEKQEERQEAGREAEFFDGRVESYSLVVSVLFSYCGSFNSGKIDLWNGTQYNRFSSFIKLIFYP